MFLGIKGIMKSRKEDSFLVDSIDVGKKEKDSIVRCLYIIYYHRNRKEIKTLSLFHDSLY